MSACKLSRNPKGSSELCLQLRMEGHGADMERELGAAWKDKFSWGPQPPTLKDDTLMCHHSHYIKGHNYIKRPSTSRRVLGLNVNQEPRGSVL